MKVSIAPLLFLLCGACGNHALDAGNNNLEPVEAGSCGADRFGQAYTPGSANDCGGLLVGRWTLCKSTPSTDPDASANLAGFIVQPGGVEFAEESGALRVYMLLADGDGGALVRASDLDKRGTLAGVYTIGSACSFHIATDADASGDLGNKPAWMVLRYTGPNALLVEFEDGSTGSYVPANPPQ
jgi:hypothetical protein